MTRNASIHGAVVIAAADWPLARAAIRLATAIGATLSRKIRPTRRVSAAFSSGVLAWRGRGCGGRTTCQAPSELA